MGWSHLGELAFIVVILMSWHIWGVTGQAMVSCLGVICLIPILYLSKFRFSGEARLGHSEKDVHWSTNAEKKSNNYRTDFIGYSCVMAKRKEENMILCCVILDPGVNVCYHYRLISV